MQQRNHVVLTQDRRVFPVEPTPGPAHYGAAVEIVGLRAQHDALVRGDVTAVALARDALARAHAVQAERHAFVTIDDDAALGAAREADRRRADGEDGPLLGVPIALKDDLDAAGHVTSWGSAAFTRPAVSDSPLVAALRRAGVVPIGRTTLPELAAYGFTESAHLGVTRHPDDPTRTPGGSSGGSAVAVAAGVVAVATASDGAGSIRIPAACCGLPGLKPTTGTMPSPAADGGEGWNGLAIQGCLTRSVADAATYLDAIGAFPTPLAAAAATAPRPLRVGVDLSPFPMAPPLALDAGVEAAVRRVADLLTGLGHRVEPVRVRPGVAALASNARFLRSLHESAARADAPDRLERRTREIARIGGLVPAAVLGAARRQGRRWGARVLADLGVDVLLTPTMRGPAPEVGRWAGRAGLATLLSMARFYAHTPAWNHTGQPAVSLPVGPRDLQRWRVTDTRRQRSAIAGTSGADALPRAVQLVAGAGEDAVLVALAAQVEGALASAV